MSAYPAGDGLHVYLFSKQEAERYTRNCYNVPPHVGLGWTPYTVIVQSYGATAHTAFHSVRQLRNWLGERYTLKGGAWNRRGFRSYVVEARKATS